MTNWWNSIQFHEGRKGGEVENEEQWHTLRSIICMLGRQLYSYELAAVTSCQLEWDWPNLTAPKHLRIQACPIDYGIGLLATNMAHPLVTNLVHPMIVNLLHSSVANLVCRDAPEYVICLCTVSLFDRTVFSFPYQHRLYVSACSEWHRQGWLGLRKRTDSCIIPPLERTWIL